MCAVLEHVMSTVLELCYVCSTRVMLYAVLGHVMSAVLELCVQYWSM